MTDHQRPEENEAPLAADIPEVEDASEPETRGDVVEDDEKEVELDVAARSLDDQPDDGQAPAPKPSAKTFPAPGEDDDLSDVARIPEPPVTTASARRPKRVGDWEFEPSAHKVVVELKRVENQVRAILEGVDSRRKRRLSGTARWYELEEDIIAWRYSGRVPEDSLRRLSDLVARRHSLFRRLRFLASTRPVMNS